MAMRVLSHIRKASLSQSGFSLAGVKHGLSGSRVAGRSIVSSPSVQSAVRTEMLSPFMTSDKLGHFSAVGLRGLCGTAGFGSVAAAQPRCQPSMGVSRLSQSCRSFSMSGVYPNMRLGFNKQRRNRGEIKGSADNHISFGKFGLEALEPAWITTKQITAAQLAIKRNMKGGKLFLRIFPHKPVSLKPAETRMGRGKGNNAYWVAGVKLGRVLFEIDGVPESVARRAIAVAASKMPIKTRFVKSLG